MKKTDDLKERLQTGDQLVLKDLYNEYFVLLRLTIGRQLSTYDFEEIFQDALLAIWDRGASFDSSFHVRNSLENIVKNKVTDAYRASERKKRMPVVPLADEDPPDEETTLFLPEINTQWTEIVNKLYQAIKQLKGRNLEVIQLHIFENKTIRETALQLGLEDNTVQTYLARALTFLRKHLKKHVTPGDLDKLFKVIKLLWILYHFIFLKNSADVL